MAKPVYSHPLVTSERRITSTRGQSIAAVGTTILPGSIAFLTNTSGGGLTLTSAPTIPDGVNGQTCLLIVVGTQPITVQDQGTLANSNLRLSAATIALGVRDSLWLCFSSDIGDWVQIGQTNVL